VSAGKVTRSPSPLPAEKPIVSRLIEQLVNGRSGPSIRRGRRRVTLGIQEDHRRDPAGTDETGHVGDLPAVVVQPEEVALSVDEEPAASGDPPASDRSLSFKCDADRENLRPIGTPRRPVTSNTLSPSRRVACLDGAA
jgi:hypothetical protein